MKIRVKSFLTLRQVMGNRPTIEIEVEKITIMGLLEKLSAKFGENFTHMIFDPETKELGQHIAVLVNGRHYSHLPDRLDTELKEGDEVAIFPPIAGGRPSITRPRSWCRCLKS